MHEKCLMESNDLLLIETKFYPQKPLYSDFYQHLDMPLEFLSKNLTKESPSPNNAQFKANQFAQSQHL